MKILRSEFLLLTLILAFGLGQRLNSEELQPTELTVNDLAEILDVHWCIVQLPNDIGANDSVGMEVISSTGEVFASSIGAYNKNWGDKVKFLFWEDQTSQSEHVLMKWLGGVPGNSATESHSGMKFSDYVPDAGGPDNGSIMKVGDILFSFSKGKKGSNTHGALKADQIGVTMVVIRGGQNNFHLPAPQPMASLRA